MDYNAAKLFLAVVQAGSLSSASEKTGVPISTLSRKMNELEQGLRVQLLDRTSQGVKPTYKGQQFFEQARMGLELLDDAQKSVQSDHKLQGKLRISIPPNFPLWWDLLTAFQRQYPDIQVFCHASERVVDLFEDGIDVALRMGDLHTDNIIAKKIMSVEPCLVASPKLIELCGFPTTLAELVSFPIATWEGINNGTFEWQFGTEKITFEPIFSTNNVEGLFHYSLNNMGVSQLLDILVAPYLDSGELVQLLPDLHAEALPIHLVYARHKHPSTIVRAYIDFCINWINNRTLK
ncbi:MULTISPECIES: LysR family transcriptional regulator [Vibrio]|uniref:LysR family transcriptional regulator n=1 Tax=Vibrio TaxID=662 RepID=UPI000B5CE8B7|nr:MULTISPECIES: LysR family transcriptional regulator [Vibrio]HBV75580.1 LysR family transcriptional regulator [Vibrio sp.]